MKKVANYENILYLRLLISFDLVKGSWDNQFMICQCLE